MSKVFYTLLIIPWFLVSPYPIFLKYSFVEITDGSKVIFESKDFEDNEIMYFKITSYDNCFSELYIDIKYFNSTDDANKDSNNYNFKRVDFDSNSESSSDISYIYTTRFFIIAKSKDDYNSYYGSNGNYILMQLYLKKPYLAGKTWAKIENTQNNESKSSSKAKIIYIVVCVVISVVLCSLVVIYFRLKMKLKRNEIIRDEIIHNDNTLPDNPNINTPANILNSYQPETADSSEKLPNNNNNKKEKPFSIIFTSVDQTVHYSVICYESNKFSEIIKELFDEYPILKTKKVCYLCEGRIIDENKTLQENKLSHNSNIIINYLD